MVYFNSHHLVEFIFYSNKPMRQSKYRNTNIALL